LACLQHRDESFYKAAGNYCRDTPFSGQLHPGKRCYREIPPRRSLFAMPSGDQVCFDANGSSCEDSYDRVAPAGGKNPDGTCSLDLVGSVGHFFADMLPSVFAPGVNMHAVVRINTPFAVDALVLNLPGIFTGQLGASVLSGRRYSQAEVKGLLAQAGWPANLIDTMSAIVMAESNGYSCAHNTSGENSVGLGQVNLHAHGQYTQAQMCDPIQNLRACYQIYRGRNGGSFRPWGAYTDGRYRRYLGAGGAAVDPPGGTNQNGGGNNNALAIAGVSTTALLAFGLLLFVVMD
jgi:hypothetical protein